MTFSNIEWGAMFRHLPAPCLVLDRDLRIVIASDRYLATVGRTMDELKGQFVFDAFPESGERRTVVEDAFRRALAGEANTLETFAYAIPVLDNSGALTGTIKEVWWTCHQNPIFATDGSVRYMIQNAQDVTQQVMAEKLKDAVVNELHHRVGNIFALVSATAKRMAGTATTLDDFVPRFQSRLMALARTHTYLTGDNWDGITVDKIVNRELQSLNDIGLNQVRASGGRIVVNATEAQILTLAIHELTTNAVKYGALKGPEGVLDVIWSPNTATGFNLEWRESGPSIVKASDRVGFGSFILDQIVPAQLRATAERRFENGQFVYSLSVPDRIGIA